MTFTDDTILPLLDRYLAGECSATDVAVVRDWLAADPEEHERLVSDIRQIRDVAKRRPPVQSAEMAWQGAVQEFGLSTIPTLLSVIDPLPPYAVLSGVVSPDEHVTSYLGREMRRLGPQPLRRGTWSAFARAVLGVLVLAVGWYVGTLRLRSPRRVAVSTYRTGNGQRANITLPDGNTVMLNVASRLDVPVDYATGDNSVHLIGEALFTVVHHAKVPFMVTTDGATARVLGTSFAVRHYSTDTTTRVAVQEGKVAVDGIIVMPSQSVEVGRYGPRPSSPVDSAAFSFATGTLMLHRRRLADAIPELDRWYNADIRLHDARLANQLFSGHLAAGSLSELASILTLTFGAHVVRDGRVLTLSTR